MQKPIDVLLISPRLPQSDPRYGGDYTYTDMLLSHPPEGVRYLFYEDLITAGEIKIQRFLNTLLSYACVYGFLPPDFWSVFLESNFIPDLLHIYGFSAYISFPTKSHSIPVILGISTGGASDLLYYSNWSESKTRIARRYEASVLRLFNIYHPSLNPRHAYRILVWSEFARKMHLWDKNIKQDQIEVLQPGLIFPQKKQERPSDRPITFLFIAVDFQRKNGALAVEAFRRTRRLFPEARFIVISQTPTGEPIREEGVIYEPYVPREELYERIYPSADVLVLPSKADGFGMVILEAMSFGLPVIGIDAWAMPEIISGGENGFIIPPDSIHDLTECMVKFARNPMLCRTMGERSRQIFRDRFSLEKHNRRLKEIYLDALALQRY